MKNMRKWILLGLLFVFVIVGFCFLVLKPNSSNTSHAKVTIEESKIYQKKEIEDAIEKVFEKFQEFPATLEEIRYQDNKSVFDSWALNYGKDEAIVLMTNFTTYDNEEVFQQGFERNEKYEKWMWILVRNKGEDWDLKTWGWG